MTTYIRIGGVDYPANIIGKIKDSEWDGRMSKAITLAITYTEASTLFHDGTSWSIVETNNEEPQIEPTIFDNSDYSILGDIIIHSNGTTTIKMGRPTELEEARSELEEILYSVESALTEGVESID